MGFFGFQLNAKTVLWYLILFFCGGPVKYAAKNYLLWVKVYCISVGDGAKIITNNIPGPIGERQLERLKKLSPHIGGTHRLFFDIQNSDGNYIQDADGNRFLDCFNQIS